jgi:hypothetical protein
MSPDWGPQLSTTANSSAACHACHTVTPCMRATPCVASTAQPADHLADHQAVAERQRRKGARCVKQCMWQPTQQAA